jgi:hypothetical protein
MEAATLLPFAQVSVRHGRLTIDALVVDDEAVVRLARDATDPTRFVLDALGVGARVLDREQTSAQTDVVKAEFERMRSEFTERSKAVADRLDQKVDQAFAPGEGHVSRVLARHFGDESSGAVQHKVRAVVTELAGQIREDVRKQFTSTGQDNPIVAIQQASLRVIRDNASQQAERLAAMDARLEAMRVQMSELKAEKEKLESVAAEVQRGTAKGRSYEESVYEALDAISQGQGDDCDAVGDTKGVGGRKGDVVIALDACAGPARGRIVIEAKNSRLSKRQALDELDEAMATRDADYAIFVVPSEDRLPARTHDLREFNGNKLFVVFDPESGARGGLEVAYKLARARVLMARGDTAGIDPAAVRSEVERAFAAMEDVRRVKSQLTQATTYIGEATKIVDTLATNVRGHLGQIDALLRPAEDDADVEAR